MCVSWSKKRFVYYYSLLILLSVLTISHGVLALSCDESCTQSSIFQKNVIQGISIVDSDTSYSNLRTVGSDWNNGLTSIQVEYSWDSKNGSGWLGSIASEWFAHGSQKFSETTTRMSKQWTIQPNSKIVVSAQDWDTVEVYEGVLYSQYRCYEHNNFYFISTGNTDWASWKSTGTNVWDMVLY